MTHGLAFGQLAGLIDLMPSMVTGCLAGCLSQS